MSAVPSGSVVSIAWQFWSDVISTVLDGAGIMDSEVLQTVRNENEYWEELREYEVLCVAKIFIYEYYGSTD